MITAILQSRSRGFLAGTVLVAVLLLTGIGISIGVLLRQQPAAPTATWGQRRIEQLASGGSICGLTGQDPAGTSVTAAPRVRWVTVGTMAAPRSAAYGPGQVAGSGARSCFAHTATGAVLAVANVWAMGSDPRLYRDVLQHNTVPGAGQRAALAANVPASNTGVNAQILGFRVTGYRPASATVEIAFALSDGTQIGFPTPVRWQDGDWKVELAPDGTPVYRPTVLQSQTGYVLWQAGQ